MLACNMLNKLILSVVFYRAEAAGIWLVVGMASFVISAISNGGKPLGAVSTVVGFFTSMGPRVNE